MKWYVRRVIYSGIAYLVISLPISALIPSICGCVYCTRLNFSSYMQFIYNCFVSRQFWSLQTEKLISSFLLTHLSSIIMRVIIAKVTTVLWSGNSILRAPIWHIYIYITRNNIKQQSLSSYYLIIFNKFAGNFWRVVCRPNHKGFGLVLLTPCTP